MKKAQTTTCPLFLSNKMISQLISCKPNINYSIPIQRDDANQYLFNAVGTYEGTLTVYDPKTKQVIPSDFDNHVSAKFELYLHQFT